MKQQRGFTIIELLFVFVVVWVAGSYIGNVVRLLDCDFKEDYKCEIVHGIGLIPGISLVTVWYGDDNDT